MAFQVCGSTARGLGRTIVAYRDRPDLYLGRPTARERRQRYDILWLMPVLVLAPNLGRIVKALGFKASYNLVLGSTIVFTGVCIVGAYLSYKAARAQPARDLAELTDPER